ncbi:conserved hypothetical protein [Perkinsus marinus ATCC 50983]|uniref:2-oxoisovalerate dehydrogenase subunit alpha n=1 Tax=Perkinsus marinus (strain ATCC 50983 / TXsc) TaxID=423536 RepID=C5L7S4_PERM5|nr:conserved hypothetical protein [Perkinsus marinus ATCC 50983]EER07536.1 conserved hypothetical protein [Perkinsus marinus ATCC 50983]|eukprot:XP_002775720.1 conserved hypothetical protein [Perkinsus marinus ATCC 50983]
MDAKEKRQTLFPGIKATKWTNDITFLTHVEPLPIYRRLDEQSNLVCNGTLPFTNDQALHILDIMIRINAYDQVLYDVQRQGRITFYMTNFGEEATQIGVVAALKEQDMIWPQYRELGVFLYRGFTTQQVTDQCMSTMYDQGKGRQMPVHYCYPEGNIQAVSSPLGVNIPHASGAGYSFKLDNADRCAVTFFGDGAASEGDFATAINFASLMKSQTIFVCRNNGYAISTPVSEQYTGDGIAIRGIAYGIHSLRVDGNDVIAVYEATKRAREITISGEGPVLLELMTYRRGHHSTSDDSSRYRPDAEVQSWLLDGIDPISRYYNLLVNMGLITKEEFLNLGKKYRAEVLDCLKVSAKHKKAPIIDMFNDVYDNMPWNLREQ